MQINTSGALLTAVISAVIGFGIAFFIERKLSNLMQKKSQKILTTVAMTSFGYGLTATLNEVIGFPLQGLHIRYDKLAVYVAANMLMLPIVLLVIAKLIGLSNKATNVDLGVPSNPDTGSFLKYFLMLAGALAFAYFGYVALEGSASDTKYDFYSRVDYKNCNSPFAETPVTLKFNYKKETNEIFVTAEFIEDGIKKQQIHALDKCSILDAKNWTCGGEWTGRYRGIKYSLVNGELTYDFGTSVLKDDGNCPVKIVKR